MVSMKLFTLATCVSSALAEAATTPYTTTKSHTTGPPPYSTTPPVSTQTMWGLCGGLAFSFTGSVVCTSIASCAHFNSFYWQCIPPATTTTVATTTSSKPVYPPTTLVSLTLPPTSNTASTTASTTKSKTLPPTSKTASTTASTTKSKTLVSLTLPPASSTTTSRAASSTGTPPVGVPVYAQCGGQGFTGSTICVAGATCVKLNDFFSQCLKNDAIPSSTTIAATTTKSVLNPEQTENAQCGGSGWTGATTCVDGLYCRKYDADLSLCRPS